MRKVHSFFYKPCFPYAAWVILRFSSPSIKSTVFGINYDIYENGRQFQTDTGPLDILALRNDNKEFLVLELKRDKASDIVVGQTLRYMGYIKNNIAKNNQKVRGCIIVTEEDQGLRNALSITPDIDFYKYQVNFLLNKI